MILHGVEIDPSTEKIDLDYLFAEDIPELKQLEDLTSLSFSLRRQYLEETEEPLAFLADLPKLEELGIYLDDNSVTSPVDISVLNELRLKWLSLAGKLDYSSLNGINLKKLYVYSDIDLQQLQNIGTVEELYIEDVKGLECLQTKSISHLKIDHHSVIDEPEVFLSFKDLQKLELNEWLVEDLSFINDHPALEQLILVVRQSEQNDAHEIMEVATADNANILDEYLFHNDGRILKEFLEETDHSIVIFTDINQ